MWEANLKLMTRICGETGSILCDFLQQLTASWATEQKDTVVEFIQG